MGLFDTIKSTVSSALGSLSAEAIPGIINQVYPGGLPGLLGQLQQSGYAQQVNSWLGRGPNDPITADDLRNAIGDEHIRQIADKFGIPADKILESVAQALPEAVDRQSPDGTLEPQSGGTPQG